MFDDITEEGRMLAARAPAFTDEFKQEAVRLMQERRAKGWTLTQVSLPEQPFARICRRRREVHVVIGLNLLAFHVPFLPDTIRKAAGGS